MRTPYILVLVLLTSCGFHLRGVADMPPEFAEMRVVDAGDASDIIYDLSQALQERGINVTDTAAMTMRIRGESFSKRVLSVDSSGQATEYELIYKVWFGLLGTEGRVWVPDELVSIQRDLQFDAQAVLGSSSEESLLQDEMRRDAIQQIIRRLEFTKEPIKDSMKSE